MQDGFVHIFQNSKHFSKFQTSLKMSTNQPRLNQTKIFEYFFRIFEVFKKNDKIYPYIINLYD